LLTKQQLVSGRFFDEASKACHFAPFTSRTISKETATKKQDGGSAVYTQIAILHKTACNFT